MAGVRLVSVFVSFLFIILFCDAALKLNFPKLMLAYHSQMVANYTLKASEGCLLWQSTRTDVISVHPRNPDAARGCSREAVVLPVLRRPRRETASVIAKDCASGRELSCDVIVDVITSFKIRTTTKELYLDDSPEEFTLLAFNDKGDVFSSLEGMEFEWNLLPDQETGGDMPAPNKVLRILKFHESSYMAPSHIRILEEQGKRGNMLLVKGLHTGTAIVQARSTDEAYRHLEIPAIRVMVVANLQLSPGFVYLILHDSIQFRVELIKQGKAQGRIFDDDDEVTMPSPLYYFEVDDSSVVDLDVSTSTVTGVSYGFTQLRLKGHNALLEGIFREPTAGIHVVNPASIEFSVSPNSWVFQTGSVYSIGLHLYDERGRPITITQNARFETEFPTKTIEVMHSTENGSYHIVRAISGGSADLRSCLVSLLTKDGRAVNFDSVEGRQPLRVLDPVTLSPSLVVLPRLPEVLSVDLDLQAAGGTGNYIWTSDDPDFCQVDQGRVKVRGRTGETQIRAVDSKHFDFAASTRVVVVSPTHLKFAEEKVEVEVGKLLRVPIRMIAGNEQDTQSRITMCHHFPLDFNMSHEDVFGFSEVSESLEMTFLGSCAVLILRGMIPGSTTLTISDHLIGLEATITLSSYLPLKVVEPRDWVILMPGSSSTVILSGGPLPWILDPSRFYRSVSQDPSEHVIIDYGEVTWNSDASRGEHVLTLRCLDLGESSLSIEIGNGPTSSNKSPESSSTNIIVFCSEPEYMKLSLDVAISDSCLIIEEVPFDSERSTILRAELYDELSRVITFEASSLKIDWSLSDESLATLDFFDHSRTDVVVLRPTGKVGRLIVSASVDSNSQNWLISGSMSFLMTTQPCLSKIEMIMYNHKSVRGCLSILGGSSRFQVVSDAEDKAHVAYDESKMEIAIVPLQEGRFKVSVTDLCLLPTKPVLADVFVSDVGSIVLSGPRKVPLHGEVKLKVEVYDQNGRLIPGDFHPLMGLSFEVGSDLLHFGNWSKPYKERDSGGLTYRAEAFSLGTASLVISIPRDGMKLADGNKACHDDGDSREHRCRLFSNKVEIQVFAPLRVKPKEITITPGTVFQFHASGGPWPDASVEFQLEAAGAVATVSKSGLVRALTVGVQKVKAASVGMEDGLKVIHSEDFAAMNVVQMTGVRISCPIWVIESENEMPLVAMGTDGQVVLEPYSFSSEAVIDWMLSNPHVALLRSPFKKKSDAMDVGLHGKGFFVRFVALTPGHVTVTLKVTDGPRGGQHFVNSVVIEVVDSLRLTLPMETWPNKILLTPGTEVQLATSLNNEPNTSLKYSVVLNEELVSIGDQGLLRSGPSMGVVPVLLTAQNSEKRIRRALSLTVEVKPIRYIMIRPISHFHDGGYRLPVGHSFELGVGCHDDFGSSFRAVQADFSFQLNRIDILEVVRKSKDDGIFAVRTLNVGFTVLKIYSTADPQIADYIGIEVVNPLKPKNVSVPLGSIVCFESVFPEIPDHRPHWSSANDDLISIDQSGIAVTQDVGTTRIVYAHRMFMSETEVTIVPVTKISLESTQREVVSNAMASKKVKVLAGTRSEGVRKMVIGSNCLDKISNSSIPTPPFDCWARFSPLMPPQGYFALHQIFNVVAFFDIKSGDWYCKFTTLDLSEKSTYLLATFHGWVHLTATTLDKGTTSDPVELDFLSAFHIVDTGNLTLGPERMEANISVLTNDEVMKELMVSSSDKSIVRVFKLPMYVDGVATFFLSVPSLPRKEEGDRVAEVVLACKASGQEVRIEVKVKSGIVRDRTPWGIARSIMHGYYNWIFYGSILFFSALLVILVYQMIQESQPGFVSGNGRVFIAMNSPENQQMQQPQQQLRSRGRARRLWFL